MGKISINMKEGKIIKDDPFIIGIDLGTTHSLVAFKDHNVTEVIKSASGGSSLIPSIIHFDIDGNILVGEKAKAKLTVNPERTIYSVKRLMGKSYGDVGIHKHLFSYKIIDENKESLVKIQVGDKYYSPVELSSYILRELKNIVENRIGKPVDKAVITVPAYFNDSQRQATRDAGKLAGLNVLRIINEPTAASLAYGIGMEEGIDKTIAVYDLGGGTFDISILRIQNGIFEVLSTHGDTFLGGDDFDASIVEYWMEKFESLKNKISNQKVKSQELRLLAEKAKKHLSSEDFFEEDFYEIKLTLGLEQFNSVIKDIVDRSIMSCRSALKDAKIEKKDLSVVILVGGSTRVRLVKEKVRDFFKTEINDKLNPDEIVAQGAAIQANILAGKQKGILLLDVTPLSLGIETLGGLMDVIIPRNNKVPARAGRQYTTSKDGQKNLKISVYQGERDLVEHNRKLGEFILSGIPPMPAGLPKIEIQFILDADGILRVKAKELRSNTAQEIEIKSQYGLSEEEMAEMLLDSIKNAEKDMVEKAILEVSNEASSIIQATKKFLVQNKDMLSKKESAKITKLALDLEDQINTRNKDSINTAIDKINTYTSPLAQKAMEKAISESIRGRKI